MPSTVRRFAVTALRIAVCVAALAYIASQLSWERIESVVRQADWRGLCIALIALAPVPFAMALRLQWLMHANAIPLSFGRCVAITFAANFANFVLPGQTGGDVVKAVAIARGTHRRHEAATVVLFDRMLGLFCVTLLSGAMLFINWRDPAVKTWGRSIGVFFVAMFVPAALYYSHWFRRLIRWERMVDRLPLGDHIRRIDEAVLVYRRHRLVVLRCAVLTWLLQGIAILSTMLTGQAIGVAGASVAYTFQVYFLYVPLCWMAGALPISPQGLGVVEWAYNELLFRAARFGTAEGATMLSLMIRVMNLLWALPGVAYYLRASRAAASAPR